MRGMLLSARVCGNFWRALFGGPFFTTTVRSRNLAGKSQAVACLLQSPLASSPPKFITERCLQLFLDATGSLLLQFGGIANGLSELNLSYNGQPVPEGFSHTHERLCSLLRCGQGVGQPAVQSSAWGHGPKERGQTARVQGRLLVCTDVPVQYVERGCLEHTAQGCQECVSSTTEHAGAGEWRVFEKIASK